jgi:hypothetical protein
LSEQTPAFLADLQRDFQLGPEIVDQLRTPYMLEEIAQLGSLRETVSLTTNPLADAARFENPVARGNDSIADAMRTSRPLDRATRTISENLATTDLSTRMLTTKDLSYSRTASDDITGHKARMRQLDTWGEIDRKMKRLTYPFGED